MYTAERKRIVAYRSVSHLWNDLILSTKKNRRLKMLLIYKPNLTIKRRTNQRQFAAAASQLLSAVLIFTVNYTKRTVSNGTVTAEAHHSHIPCLAAHRDWSE
jgi:hypothetical protein